MTPERSKRLRAAIEAAGEDQDEAFIAMDFVRGETPPACPFSC